jgi:hypothetical protein
MEMSIEAMKQALGALTDHGAPYLRHGVDWDDATNSLRAAIAEQEKAEPFGVIGGKPGAKSFECKEGISAIPIGTKLYTHPAPVEKCEHVLVTTFGGDYCIKCDAPIEKAEPVAWKYQVGSKVHLETHRLDNYYWYNGSYVKGTPVYGHPAQPPEGWRLVPVEPTEKQWAEGKIVLEAMFDCGTSIDIGLIYKVMLQAAPKQGEIK